MVNRESAYFYRKMQLAQLRQGRYSSGLINLQTIEVYSPRLLAPVDLYLEFINQSTIYL